MTTISNGTFNINPYYDDFDASKNFMQVLFAPGRAVQARELTQAQTGILDQIRNFGDHVFTDGTPVINGKITVNDRQRWILIEQGDMNENFVGQLITGASSGARAVVEHIHSDHASNPYLYIKEIGGTFHVGESVSSADPVITAKIQGMFDPSSVYATEFGGVATFASNDDGIYYVNGLFVPVESQTVMIDKSSSTSNDKVGFTVHHEVITASDDLTLLDPAHGFYNYNAPGADRHKVTLTLNTLSNHDVDKDFINLMTLVEGDIVTSIDRTYNAVIEETIARRTFDESGNYTVKPFLPTIINNVPNTDVDGDKYVVKLDPGKGYVNGFEVETRSPLYMSTDRARLSERRNNGALYYSVGPYIELDPSVDVVGTRTYEDKWGFNISKQEIIDFFDSSGNFLFNTRIKYIIGTKMYLCSSCDDFALMRSAKVVKSHLTPTVAVANLMMNEDGIAEMGDIERMQNPSILKMPESNVKSVVNNETHFTSHRVFNSSISSGTVTISTGSTQITFNSIVQVVNETDDTVVNPSVYSSSISGIGTNTCTMDFDSVTGSVKVIAALNVGQSSFIPKTMGIHTDTGLTHVDGVFTLSKYDIYDIVSVTGSSIEGIGANMRLDNGQLDHIYTYGKLTWAGANPLPTSETITVVYRQFDHGDSAGYFSIDSYYGSYDNTATGYTDLPLPYENDRLKYVNEVGTSTYYLRDVLDFRPNITSIDSTNRLYPVNDTVVYADYDYYMPRIDCVVLDSDGTFKIVKGVDDLDPIMPNIHNNSMLLYKLFVPAYTFNVSDIGLETVNNKRYTMRDIGLLEKRIEKEEYYTALSLLEQSALDLNLTDDNGLERYKNGILVDNFTGHGVGDVGHEEYNISVDSAQGALRMPFSQRMIDMEKASEVTVGTDEINNIRWHSNTVTMSYDAVPYITQLQASQVMNVNPYNVFAWSGTMSLAPDTDFWVDTETMPDVLVNFDGNMDNWFTDSAWNSSWNSWQTNVTGVNRNETVVGSTTSTETVDVDWGTRRTDTTTTEILDVSLDVVTQQSRSGLRSRTIPETVTQALGERVVDVSVVPFMRGGEIQYKAVGLKPNTSFHATFDGELSDLHCLDIGIDPIYDVNGALVNGGGGLTSDANGTVEGTFTFPSGVFKAGERVFRLADDLTNPTTSAEARYNASGLLQTQERTVASVTSFRTEVESLFEAGASTTGTTGSIDTVAGASTTTTTVNNFRWRDPLAQSFLVSNMSGGMFITSLDIFFKSKDENIPCLIEVREMINGYPGQIILPYSTVSLLPDDIITVGNEEAPVNATSFTFSDPVYLQNNTEYCFAIISDSDGYEVYTAKMGESEATTSGLGPRINKQPYMGVMFKSQNGSTWTADQNMDITFRVNRAKFDTASTGNVGKINMFNANWEDVALDGSDHVKITTMMPTIEHMSLAGSNVDWEINFQGGDLWRRFENYNNVSFSEQLVLDGSPTPSDPTQVRIKGTIEADRDNISPIINHTRIGVVGVANTGSSVSKCNINNTRTPGFSTEQECVAAGGTWESDVDNYTIEGDYVTRAVTLAEAADDINVWITADKPQGTDVNVYYDLGGTVKRYVEVGTDIDTDGYTIVYADDFERQYVHFYTSDNVAFTLPDAGAMYGTRAYANRDRDHGVTDQRRLYLVNIDDVAQIQYGGWMSKEDLRDSTVWDSAITYIEDDLVKAGDYFYKCVVSHIDQPPTVASDWRTYWKKVLMLPVESTTLTATATDPATAKDPALISEDKINWLPMEPVETSSFSQAQQSASTQQGETVSSGWVEYQWSTLDKIEDPFTVFRVKVELKAQNPAIVARVKDFRAIASS